MKQRIFEEKGWDPKAQKLIYSGMQRLIYRGPDLWFPLGADQFTTGKILKDDDTVETYKIEEKGFVVCMVNKV